MRATVAALIAALLVVPSSMLAGCDRRTEQAAPAAAQSSTAAEPSAAPPAPQPSADVPPPEGVLRAYVWNCDGGLVLNVKNLYRENAVALDLPEGPRRLPLVESASGARYSDGSLTFWTKGDTAMLEREGSAPLQCREARYESLLADARERGVRYRGRGNEPGWTVEIGPGTRIEFVTDYGQQRRTFDAASESGSETAGARVFRAEHGSQRIKVSVTTEPCTDDMSDERFAERMIVEFGGRTYRGCATALQ
jgi:uncharacterized membrane protein